MRRVNGNDIHYVYAEPVVCGCLYIGTQRDFALYASNQQLDAAQAQRIAFLNHDDAAWNWDAWGPWGPLGRFTARDPTVKYPHENQRLAIDQVALMVGS